MSGQVIHLSATSQSGLEILKEHHPQMSRGEIVTFLIREELERLAKQPVFVSALSKAGPTPIAATETGDLK